jgi:uncharacterized protein
LETEAEVTALALPARRGGALFLLILLSVLALIPHAQAQTFPPLTGRVVDAAKLLSPEQVTQLDQLSASVEAASARQLVVATVPDLQGYPIEDYGYRLGRAWKIGQAEANNGVILLVAPTERKVRIEVGYGLEPIVTDAVSSQIINNTILPRFRANDMTGGIVAGAQSLGEQLKLPLEAAEVRAKAAADAQNAKRSRNSGGFDFGTLFWIAIILFFVLPSLFRRRGGRRHRRGGMPVILWGPGFGGGSGGGGGWGSSGGSSWGGGGGFSGGGGSFGGGGASGSW